MTEIRPRTQTTWDLGCTALITDLHTSLACLNASGCNFPRGPQHKLCACVCVCEGNSLRPVAPPRERFLKTRGNAFILLPVRFCFPREEAAFCYERFTVTGGWRGVEKPHQCDDGALGGELSGAEQGPDKAVDLLLLWVAVVVVQRHL